MSIANTNPETGIRYGIVSANTLYPEIIDEIQGGGRDTHWEAAVGDLRKEVDREADAIEEEVRISIAESDPALVGNEDWEERRIEDAYFRMGYPGREDYVEAEVEKLHERYYDDEPIHEFDIDGVKGRTTWLGGALLVWIFESPFKTKAKLCSPCVPNCGDLDSLDPDGFECYDVPGEWRT